MGKNIKTKAIGCITNCLVKLGKGLLRDHGISLVCCSSRCMFDADCLIDLEHILDVPSRTEYSTTVKT